MSKDKLPQAWIDSLLLEARLKDLEYQCYEAGSYPAVWLLANIYTGRKKNDVTA